MADEVRSGRPFDLAPLEFLDEFYLCEERRPALIAAEPVALAQPQHAFLGAVGEHLARRWGLPIPAWAEAPERFLRRPWLVTPLEDIKAYLLIRSPLAFRRRMIFVEGEPLRRTRMPRVAITAAA